MSVPVPPSVVAIVPVSWKLDDEIAPTLMFAPFDDHSSAVSSQYHLAFPPTSVPRLTSIPASCVAAPVWFEFRSIRLSSISTVSDSVVVTAPETVRFPDTTASPVTFSDANVVAPAAKVLAPKSPATPNVAVVSVSVTLVDVALSSIPVDAKFEIVPPCTLSPEIWLSASVSVPADTSSVLPAPTVISYPLIVEPVVPTSDECEIVPPCTLSPEIASSSNEIVEPLVSMSIPVIVPPVMLTLPDVRFVNEPFVTPVTLPPVI